MKVKDHKNIINNINNFQNTFINKVCHFFINSFLNSNVIEFLFILFVFF